jgi:hypothetical protein
MNHTIFTFSAYHQCSGVASIEATEAVALVKKNPRQKLGISFFIFIFKFPHAQWQWKNQISFVY